MPQHTLRQHTSETTPQSLANDQLETLQHFIELGRLSASLLHEISNPLTAALLYLDQPNGQSPAHVRQARRSLGLLRNYVEAARQQIRHHSPQLSAFCIHPQIEQVKRLVLPLARAEDVQLVFEGTPHYRLYGDPVKFQQMIANLIINAIDAYANSAADGLAKPVRVSMSGTAKSVVIKVIDWGEGIPADQLAQVFEPFFTTKSHGQHGLGIGLTIVTGCFHGSISVSSSHRNGTQFALKLPALSYSASHFRKKS
jgi:two-component system C4-dicarboxylate transport sensor histidine kinase DctB